eukprot:9420754-Pyramimonas_sp.AAC.1
MALYLSCVRGRVELLVVRRVQIVRLSATDGRLVDHRLKDQPLQASRCTTKPELMVLTPSCVGSSQTCFSFAAKRILAVEHAPDVFHGGELAAVDAAIVEEGAVEGLGRDAVDDFFLGLIQAETSSP